jgi:hypothetical protein
MAICLVHRQSMDAERQDGTATTRSSFGSNPGGVRVGDTLDGDGPWGRKLSNAGFLFVYWLSGCRAFQVSAPLA